MWAKEAQQASRRVAWMSVRAFITANAENMVKASGMRASVASLCSHQGLFDITRAMTAAAEGGNSKRGTMGANRRNE